MSLLKSIKKGDNIRIKFKHIDEIANLRHNLIAGSKRINEWQLGNNIKAFLVGKGDFVVQDTFEEDQTVGGKKSKLHWVEVNNHLDCTDMDIYEEMIESIEIIEPSNLFVSEIHGISIVELGGVLYINGKSLVNDPEDDYKKTTRLNDFMAFMEKFITSKALERSLSNDTE